VRSGVREASSRSRSTRRRREGLGSSWTLNESQICACLGVILGEAIAPLTVPDRGEERILGRGVPGRGWEMELWDEGGVERGEEVALEKGRFVGVVDCLGEGRGGVVGCETVGFEVGVEGRGDATWL
jgi:hypothetical protein